jgi:hypothetical protein
MILDSASLEKTRGQMIRYLSNIRKIQIEIMIFFNLWVVSHEVKHFFSLISDRIKAYHVPLR